MSHQRIKAVLRGAVQGAGFRPFISQLATSLGLNGWVANAARKKKKKKGQEKTIRKKKSKRKKTSD